MDSLGFVVSSYSDGLAPMESMETGTNLSGLRKDQRDTIPFPLLSREYRKGISSGTESLGVKA
jgi:hypothetical protein